MPGKLTDVRDLQPSKHLLGNDVTVEAHFNCRNRSAAHCLHTCNGIEGVATCKSAVRICGCQVNVRTSIAGEVCTAYFRQAYVCSLVFSGSDRKGIGRTINSVRNVCG